MGQTTGHLEVNIRHGPPSRRCLCATDMRRDTGLWRCSSDRTDDGTLLIARRYLDHKIKFIITSLICRNSVQVK